MNDTPTVATYVLAAVIAYTLGSLPVAYIAARSKGIDIFKVGSRQAGATNVFREVSRPLGIAVFFIDSTKGLMAMLTARWLGLDGTWLLLPAAATILGHWNSPMTLFKGGDGVSSLTGVGLGIAPQALALPYALIAFITLGFNSRLEHPTLWGAVMGYLLFLAIAFIPSANVNPGIVIGFTLIGIAILLHSMVYHRRKMRPEAQSAETPADTEADVRVQSGRAP